jgi:hypothetical protein
VGVAALDDKWQDLSLIAMSRIYLNTHGRTINEESIHQGVTGRAIEHDHIMVTGIRSLVD